MLGSNHWTAGDFSDMGLKMAQLEVGCNNVRSLRMTTSKSFQEKKKAQMSTQLLRQHQMVARWEKYLQSPTEITEIKPHT